MKITHWLPHHVYPSANISRLNYNANAHPHLHAWAEKANENVDKRLEVSKHVGQKNALLTAGKRGSDLLMPTKGDFTSWKRILMSENDA